MNFILQITIILLASYILKLVFNKLHWPVVIGQLLLGVILGPSTMNLISPNHELSNLSELGVILLMFLAGLDTDFEILKKYARASTIIAVLGVIIPMIVIYPLGLLFNFSNSHSIFLAVIFAATSVSITIEVLRELNYLKSKASTIILGAAVIDDFIAIILLSIVDSGSNSIPGWQLVIGWIIFSLVLLIFGIFFEPIFDKLISKNDFPYKSSAISILLMLLAASAADFVHLDYVLGAFLIGIIIGQSKFKNQIIQNIGSMANLFFIPIFFLSIGLPVSFKNFGNNLTLIIVLSVAAIVSKFFGAWLGAKISNLSNSDANIIGSGMISRGEMALIIAQLGFQQHLISENHYTAIILAIVVVTISAPILIKRSLNDH